MSKIEIFDPAMCCSTGVCGPSIDPELMRIATTINSLKEKGIVITRHNLSSEPQAFITNEIVNEIIKKEGAEVLPITLLNGEAVKTKVYPTDNELSEWLNIEIEVKKNKGGCCSESDCC